MPKWDLRKRPESGALDPQGHNTRRREIDAASNPEGGTGARSHRSSRALSSHCPALTPGHHFSQSSPPRGAGARAVVRADQGCSPAGNSCGVVKIVIRRV
ncbi:MAG: hypothetical protein ACYDHX_16755 [Methanothrix sp.]